MRVVKGYKALRAFGITMVPQHILRLMKLGKFPPCGKVGNVCWWRVADIEAWCDGLPTPPKLPQRE
jgi:predicted DNA-binding transcriptional regulator AlpA